MRYPARMELDIWLRLLCAMVAGMALGLERESHGRAAGLRTIVLVCIASCIGMILSESFYKESFSGNATPGWHPDPARLAAGVLAGMGFIGGGVILKQGDLIRGVTTASILWMASFLGMVFGSGRFALGFSGLALSLLTVLGFPYLERWVYADWYSTLTLVSKSPDLSASSVCGLLEKHGVRVKQVHVELDMDTQRKTLSLRLKYKKRDLIGLPEHLVSELSKLPGIQKISCH
jgi:putative Mg2+ transporter-C (MgtC) family protein